MQFLVALSRLRGIGNSSDFLKVADFLEHKSVSMKDKVFTWGLIIYCQRTCFYHGLGSSELPSTVVLSSWCKCLH